ncbi:hypothetical protein BKA64DRAFT_759233 [Cadophora sp. MPI-SDFR-AT-0126]|nr:hypothetical protein BKA64DRAFT_759233 [Leotiomycetes sp. MPI-SDFR-AT-0126]
MSSSKLPVTSKPSSHDSSSCGKKAVMVCSDCCELVGKDVLLTWYCTKDCQKGYKIHGDNIAKDLAATLVNRILGFAKEGSFYMGRLLNDLVMFPEGTKDEDVNLMELGNYWINLEAVADIHVSIENILFRRGIARSVCERFSQIKRFNCLLEELSLPDHASKATVFKYPILKIRLYNDDEIFALDLYGAFLGKGEALTPWSEYLNDRLPSTIDVDGHTYSGLLRERAMWIGETLFRSERGDATKYRYQTH